MARTLFVALAALTALIGTQMTLSTSYQAAVAVETDRHPCPGDGRHPCPKPTKTPPPAHSFVAVDADTDRHPCPDDGRHPCPKPTKTPKP
ncbi:MAG: hypothetical protein AB7I41_08480 [Candidatus Sericytochromatia bacterium]